MYKEIFADIKKKKKFIFVSTLILIVSFIMGLKFPSLLSDYSQKAINDVLSSVGAEMEISLIAYKIIMINLESALLGIALGIFILPTFFFSFMNGYIFGTVTSGALAKFGIGGVLLRVVPHGIFEIPAAIISYALGLSIGMIWIDGLRKKEGTKVIFRMIFEGYKKSAKTFLALILPLLIAAGIFEGTMFKYQEYLNTEELQYVIYSIILLYLFYSILKLLLSYQKSREIKPLVVLSLLVLVSSALWMKLYEVRILDLLADFEILIIFIPLVAFLFYTYWENQRFKEQAAKKQIKDAFQQYMSPAVIEELLKHPEKLKLGGEKKEITVFFSDIRSFATISEKFTPEKLVHVLNEYLSAMTEIIIKNKGVVDKYIGDAIMAFWNAPLDEPEHARLACLSALEMTRKLKELNKKWIKDGVGELKIGIGLNTGEVIVGNMGSIQRFDYTIIGDNVNLASRIETLNKVYGCPVLASEFTHEKVKDSFACREVDFVMVQGRQKPTRLYEIVCKKEEETKEIREFIKIFEKGLELYRDAKWDEAIKSFEKSAKFNNDATS